MKFFQRMLLREYFNKRWRSRLITNNTLTKSFLILAVNTQFKNLKKDSNEYEQYEAKARLSLINKIYQTHDNSLNEKYKVELNKKTIERVKNSF